MQAGRRYKLWHILKWGRKYIILFIIYNTLIVAFYQVLGYKWLAIPWQPISLIGVAVAFYLGFKNNSSYERLWEARKIWGAIVNASRTFTILSRDFISNTFTLQEVDSNILTEQRIKIVKRHIAWLYALTYQLREMRPWEHQSKKDNTFRKEIGVSFNENFLAELGQYVSSEDLSYLNKKGNKASHLISLQSKAFKKLREKGIIDDFRHMRLSELLEEFYALQGKSERIKNFPFPRQYGGATYFFVALFLVILPFGMLNVFGNSAAEYMIWLSIPITVATSWFFWTMEMIGDYSENPFEGLYNDVPITSLARSIEIDILQMLEETDLPEPIPPATKMKIQY